jgi:GNAT superfamily N-acetyltransferase
MLARSFDDDPIWTHIFPDAARRPRRLELMFGPLLEIYIRHSVAHVAVDRRDDGQSDGGNQALPLGAAMWGRPGHWRTSAREILPHLVTFARAFGVKGLGHLRDLQRIEQLHEPYAREPHHYLGVLGTEPTEQGRGVGSALVAHTLARADEEGLGAYLESSKESNVPFYGRFGFEVVGDHTFRNGPTVYLMWRKPRG